MREVPRVETCLSRVSGGDRHLGVSAGDPVYLADVKRGGGGARVPTAAASRFCVVAANYGTWPGLCQTTRGNPVDITSQFVIHRVFLECIRVCVDWAGRA